MPAMKRHTSMPAAVCWNAMMAVQMEYQSREKRKMERRPRRSAMKPNPMQPRNIPAKLQEVKKPMELCAKKVAEVVVNNPPAVRPGAM